MARRSYSGFSGKRRGSANRPNYLPFANASAVYLPFIRHHRNASARSPCRNAAAHNPDRNAFARSRDPHHVWARCHLVQKLRGTVRLVAEYFAVNKHDSVHIGDLRAAQPPDVGRAGHLLFPRSPILLRKRGTLKGDAATHRYRKAQENSMRSHAYPFFGLKRVDSARKVLRPTD